MAKKSICWVGYEDFKIMEDDATVGTIRIKPSGLLWKARGKHSWLKVSIEDFAALAEDLDIKVKK